MKPRNAYCSFCRKSYQEVGPLVEGPGEVYICSECVPLCQSIIDQEKRRRKIAPRSSAATKSQSDQDDKGIAFHSDAIAELEEDVSALARQYDRAVAVDDEPAAAVEREAIYGRVRDLVFHHLGLAVGITSDNWVWPSATLHGWTGDRPSPAELFAAGQIQCGLPQGDYFMEPCSAHFQFAAGGSRLDDYTIRFGRRATLLNLSEVQAQFERGTPPEPCPASDVSEWAYVFHRKSSLASLEDS